MRDGLRGSAVGRGIYSLADVARFARLRPASVKRYLLGRSLTTKTGTKDYKPWFHGDYVQEVDGKAVVTTASFRDLIELRFIAALERLPLPPREVRLAAEKLAERYTSSHPFCSAILGPRLVAFDGEVFEDEGGFDADHELPQFIGVVRNQLLMGELVQPFVHEVEFEGGNPLLWTPSEGRNEVVVDPRQRFGAPIVRNGGVETAAILTTWTELGNDAAAVAEWWGLDQEAVRGAVSFERQFPKPRGKRAA